MPHKKIRWVRNEREGERGGREGDGGEVEVGGREGEGEGGGEMEMGEGE